MMKDTTFYNNQALNISGKSLDLSTPKVMAIVNLTPDSFFDGGKINTESNLVEHVERQLNEGAAIIDIGGQSTRPGAQQVGAQAEWERIEKSIKTLKASFPATFLSVDTYHSEVALKAIDHGAEIINDVSCGTFDPKMIPSIVDKNIGYIANHIFGAPGDLINDNQKGGREQLYTLLEEFKTLKQKFSDQKAQLIIDPGFGFGKNTDENFYLLKHLNELTLLDLPILVGISRKSMIWKTLEGSAEEALHGTVAAQMYALNKGCNILRVHDVKAAADCIKIYNKLS